MSHFVPFTESMMLQALQAREGEVKYGETIWFPEQEDWSSALKDFTGNIVVLGIPEDLGVRANRGIGGTHTAWQPFVKSFVNTQCNKWNENVPIALLGAFDFTEWIDESAHKTPQELSAYVAHMDEIVWPVIRDILTLGKTPIVVGGGHNNAYPLIKGASKALMSPVNVINIDAHADLRHTEHRHSGNGFSTALEEGYLEKYFAIGLHENYNNQYMVQLMDESRNVDYATYESLMIRRETTLDEVVDKALVHTLSQPLALEIDLDAIAAVLSSASSPCGFSLSQVRNMLHLIISKRKPAYIHICEGAAMLNDGRSDTTIGKLLSYLVMDCCKLL